jgi:hypothetical protein
VQTPDQPGKTPDWKDNPQDIYRGEAMPLGEQSRRSDPDPETDPSFGADADTLASGYVPGEISPHLASVSVKTDGVGGMVIAPEGGMVEEIKLRSIPEPFVDVPPPRPPSRELFRAEPEQPDGELVKQFVTTARLRDLWNQMDALQEEVIQKVRADRRSTDTYQQDLLYASSLLLQSPANYDDARQIVYRVRGDLNREKRVAEDTRQYRPLILVYYGIWLIAVLLGSRLDPEFRAVMPDNLPILKLALPPILFAALGALFNGVMALIDHTSIKRDFDPVYTSWYIINPFLGALLGMVVFIFFVVTGTSFTPNLINDQSMATAPSPPATWLLAFIVGWQQNTAVKLLNGFLKLVTRDNSESARAERPSSPAPPPNTAGK